MIFIQIIGGFTVISLNNNIFLKESTMRVRSWRENVTSLGVSLGFEVKVSTTNLELLLCYLDPNWMKVIVIATPTNKVR